MSDVRTVNDFNKEYLYQCWVEEVNAASKPSKGQTIKNVIFYFVIITMVLLAFFYSGNKSPGRRFGSFAYNTVLSPSMQSVYPQGSLIFSWAVKPDEPLQAGLEGGDDIVFIKDDETVVVHRIVEIMPDYEDRGMRAFKTQGVENRSPDPWITFEGNVIGRVIGYVPFAGSVLMVIADNILWVVAIVTVICVIIALLKIGLNKDETPKPKPS